MKKSILTLAIIAMAFASCKGEKKNTVATSDEVKNVKTTENVISTNKVNIAESTITWKGTKPGGAHNGTINLERGFLDLEKDVLKSGEFVIDMKSMKNLDLDADYGAKLVGHLGAPDFFDIEKYPTSKFVITSSEAKDGKLAVTGNLTIKDVTKSITIPATISEADGVVSFKSEVFNINRADFNVKYNSKSFFDDLKDKYIDDLVEFSFNVKAQK